MTRLFYMFSLTTLVVLVKVVGGEVLHLLLVDVLDGVPVEDCHTRVLLLELSLDGSHELEVLLVPLISHCKAVSLLRSKLLSRHG